MKCETNGKKYESNGLSILCIAQKWHTIDNTQVYVDKVKDSQQNEHWNAFRLTQNKFALMNNQYSIFRKVKVYLFTLLFL